MRYRVSSAAIKDLDEAFNYFSAFSDESAAKFMDGMQQFFQLLTTQPHMGERCTQVRPDLRMFTVTPHVVFYKVVRGEVLIARIIHGSRDWQSILSNP